MANNLIKASSVVPPRTGPYAKRPITKPVARRTPASNTAYIRDTYPEDMVLQGYADLIDRMQGMWETIKLMERSKIDLTNTGVQTFHVEHDAEVGKPPTIDIAIKLVRKEILK
jgi:hypothetical protein